MIKMEQKELIGITIKKENLGEWYAEVLTKCGLIAYTEISGCYVIKPNAYYFWEMIQDYFNVMIKGDGVKNSYFPCFVTKRRLEMEAENFEGFCPEVAWVTKAGEKDLDVPIAIRPTSECIIYPHFAEWIRAESDLPLRLNQWSNVVRWEMKNCTPFLRSREFLWQEGHSCFSSSEEADDEVLKILEFYRLVYEDLLAVPVIKGIKTKKEQFAGADYTTTIEAFIPTNGRGIQAATSHSLGQNFSKAFNITYNTKSGSTEHVWQNSWGLTTRSIGIMLMTHGDNKGLIIPPKIAEIQVVIVCIKDTLSLLAKEILSDLKKSGIRAIIDTRDYTPGWKYNDWEMRGVPVRIELGERDVKKYKVTVFRRDTLYKVLIDIKDLITEITSLLTNIQSSMFNKAKNANCKQTTICTTFTDFITDLNNKNMVLVPFCCKTDCEDHIKVKSKTANDDDTVTLTSSAKSLCIPFTQPELDPSQICFACDDLATKWVLFGRSY